MTSKAITDMVLKKIKYTWKLNPGCPHDTSACYQVRYCERHEEERFSKSYQLIVKKVENKSLY
jgi:hypothetical protein